MKINNFLLMEIGTKILYILLQTWPITALTEAYRFQKYKKWNKQVRNSEKKKIHL